MRQLGERKKVLVVPPDFTRFHSRAGDITGLIYNYYKGRLADILPALGTHARMSESQLGTMFQGVPHDLFRVHDWRKDVITIGTVPGDFVSRITTVPWSIPGLLSLTGLYPRGA